MNKTKTEIDDCVANYRGKVIVNNVDLEVIETATFSGILHYGICGYDHGKPCLGWIPAMLCIIPGV
jgi:hypothetical protein